MFCGEMKVDLRAHFLSVHQEEEKIKELSTLGKKERIQAIATLRRQGILQKNTKIVASGGDSRDLMCERKSSGEKVMCSRCSGVFKGAYFYKHKKSCMSPKKRVNPRALNVRSLATPNNPRPSTEWDNVIDKMDKDRFFDIIKSDDVILQIGKHVFDTRKPTKCKDAKNNARRAMRRLARLVDATVGISTAAELFVVGHFYELEDAIRVVCQTDSDADKKMKAGLKIALGALLRMSAKILAADYIIRQQREKAIEVECFEKVFNMNYSKLFNDAEYQLKEKRQRENRKPTALPNEGDLDKLRTHVNKCISEAIKVKSTLTKTRYVQLRQVVLTRLTLLNARRGSEPARMLIDDFKERDSWIDTTKLSSDDATVVAKYSITYLMGKGEKLVPVLIPKDCEKAMIILADKTNRTAAGVSEQNLFLFAYTQMSEDGTTGYNEIMRVCQQIPIPVITATTIRHRTSSMFWSIEGLDGPTIENFMDHMGHSREVDQNIYAVPPALRTIRTVAPIIDQLDQVS